MTCLRCSLVLSVLLAVCPFCRGFSSPQPPQEEQKSFRLADPGLVAELVASEPDVISPVAVVWDEDGRLFVVEMSDYPADSSGGRVKLLQDRDGDGKYETVTVFADRLPFPTGVLPWKGSILVTAAPNIWFFQDHDGDGRADERRVVLTGFAEGNQQLRVNGLLWGLDNWVYGANGRSDGNIHRPADSAAKAVSLRRRDFRFRPETGEVEAVAGFSQFGLARDDEGRRFPSWNTVPLRHVVLEERYLNRNPALAETSTVAPLLDPADPGRIFPATPPPRTFNREPVDYFNASCGLTVYRGSHLGPQYAGNAFVCEPLTNLVHRRILEPAGATFVARRAEAGKEFLAATDPWFHPVNLATGPDGALYVVDFYRQWVEHPQFVPENLRKTVDFRTGFAHGRIWRIRRHGAALTPAPRLGKAKTAELVRSLSHDNGWCRDTAQRLLVERQDREAIPLLKEVVRQAESPLARIHALWVLHGQQALDENTLLSALRDKTPAVREQGLRLAEGPAWRSGPVGQAVLALVEDGDARVRFQCALTLGELDSADALKALVRIAQRDAADAWLRLAVLSSLRETAWPFLQALVEQQPEWLTKPTADQVQFLSQAAALVGARQRDAEMAAILKRAAESGARPGGLALLVGLAEGLTRKGGSLHSLLTKPPDALAEALRGLDRTLDQARAMVLSGKESAAHRVLALQVLTQTRPDAAGPVVLALLKPANPPAVQTAAARSLAAIGGKALALRVLEQWDDCSINTRREILTSLVRSPDQAFALVQALEEQTVAVAELGAVSREALLRLPDADLQRRARQLLKQDRPVNRQEVLRKYQAALAMKGEPQRGAALFAKNCLSCHRLQGQGHQVGPDLSGVASRPREALLTDLLDPGKEVAPDYLNFLLVTRRGQVLTGLLAAETATTVKLRRAEGAEDTVLRPEIQELRPSGQSLMPEGLEQSLAVQDVADLLEFLHKPVALPRP